MTGLRLIALEYAMALDPPDADKLLVLAQMIYEWLDQDEDEPEDGEVTFEFKPTDRAN